MTDDRERYMERCSCAELPGRECFVHGTPEARGDESQLVGRFRLPPEFTLPEISDCVVTLVPFKAELDASVGELRVLKARASRGPKLVFKEKP